VGSIGKTAGWIQSTTPLSRGGKMITGISYQRIDDEGLHLTTNGGPQTLAVDNVIQ